MSDDAKNLMAAGLQGKASGSDKPPEGGTKKRPDKSARLQKVPDLGDLNDGEEDIDLGHLDVLGTDGAQDEEELDEIEDDDEAEKPNGNKRPDPEPKEGAAGGESTSDKPDEGYAGSDYLADNIQDLCDLFGVDTAIYSGDGDRLREVVKKAKALPLKNINLESLKGFVNMAFRTVVDKVMGGKSEPHFDLSAKNLQGLLKQAEDQGFDRGKKQAPAAEPSEASTSAINRAKDEGFQNGQEELLQSFCELVGEELDDLTDDEGNKPNDVIGQALIIKQRLRKRLGRLDHDVEKDDKSGGKEEGSFLGKMLKSLTG